MVRGPLCLAEVSNHIQNLLYFQGNEAEGGEKSKTKLIEVLELFEDYGHNVHLRHVHNSLPPSPPPLSPHTHTKPHKEKCHV